MYMKPLKLSWHVADIRFLFTVIIYTVFPRLSWPLSNLVPLPWLSGCWQMRPLGLTEEEPLGLAVTPSLLCFPRRNQ